MTAERRHAPPGMPAGAASEPVTGAEEHAPRAFVPVRPPTSPAPTASDAQPLVLRRKWVEQPYSVSDTKRTLHVEEHPTVWGAAGQRPWQVDTSKPRAVLFETMSTASKLRPLVERLGQQGVTAPRDVGLSVVLNGAYVPPDQYTDKGEKTKLKRPVPKEKPAMPQELGALETRLTAERAQLVNNWAGPPLQITTAAWERRSRSEAEEPGALETVQSSVPYTSLRALAASTPGALDIGAAMEDSHENVWHKMGDDDMPIFDPNPAVDGDRKLFTDTGEPVDELVGLAQVEMEGTVVATTIVTFGYDLTTDVLPKSQVAVSDGIRAALRAVYRNEMKLRDQIRDLGAPIYPSEPTSFYRTVQGNTAADVWRTVPGMRAGGGSGQQLEGAKLIRALKANDPNQSASGSGKSEKSVSVKSRNEPPTKVGKQEKTTKSSSTSGTKLPATKTSGPTSGITRETGQREPKNASGVIQRSFHSVQVATSAGGRNDALVALLEGWRAGGDAKKVEQSKVEEQINKLDQCALKEGEYLDKVFSKLPKPALMAEGLVDKIKTLVADGRAAAAKDACAALIAEISPTTQ